MAQSLCIWQKAYVWLIEDENFRAQLADRPTSRLAAASHPLATPRHCHTCAVLLRSLMATVPTAPHRATGLRPGCLVKSRHYPVEGRANPERISIPVPGSLAEGIPLKNGKFRGHRPQHGHPGGGHHPAC